LKYLEQILALMIGFVLIMWLKGSGDKQSIIGIQKCDSGDWGLFSALIIYGVILSLISIALQRHEYLLKKEVDWQFTRCDFKYTLSSAIKFPCFAFFISFTSICVGFSPAFYYVPLLLHYNL